MGEFEFVQYSGFWPNTCTFVVCISVFIALFCPNPDKQSEGRYKRPSPTGFSFSWLSMSVFLETQLSQQTFGSCDVDLAEACVCSTPPRLHRKLSKIPYLLPSHCLLPSLIFSAVVFWQ